jgi:transcriptional regulator with GAF, ATPase, and Fis domain
VLVVKDETRLDLLERDLEERREFHHIIGKNHAMQQRYSLIEDLADVPSTVLITGETGTGKELVAQALHYRGGRSDGPFVKVNCSALAESLLESELFGHVRGAFTGAHQDKVGRFEMADGGTIFLDEIGDILLVLRRPRVLQEKEFERAEVLPVHTCGS